MNQNLTTMYVMSNILRENQKGASHWGKMQGGKWVRGTVHMAAYI